MYARRLIILFGISSLLVGLSATPALAEVEFLPGAVKTTFAGKSGEVKFVSGAGTIICKKSTTSAAELISSTSATATIAFEECTAAGLEARGLADPEKSKRITTKVSIKTCTVSTSPLVAALLIKTEPVHIEITVAKYYF